MWRVGKMDLKKSAGKGQEDGIMKSHAIFVNSWAPLISLLYYLDCMLSVGKN